jgi:prohibitin 2
VRFESQQSVIRAKSEVEALRLQRSVPPAVILHQRELDLQRRAIDKWDGHLPQSTQGIPFLPSLGARTD